MMGDARSISDPGIFHKLSLIAFFAWVGLGADGLTSSCYGPEEAFLALGKHYSPEHLRRPRHGPDHIRHQRELPPDHRALPHRRRRIPGGEQAPVAVGRHGVRVRAPYRLSPHHHAFGGQRRGRALQFPARMDAPVQACGSRGRGGPPYNSQPAGRKGVGRSPRADIHRVHRDPCRRDHLRDSIERRQPARTGQRRP